jgi:hypothetical protein
MELLRAQACQLLDATNEWKLKEIGHLRSDLPGVCVN